MSLTPAELGEAMDTTNLIEEDQVYYHIRLRRDNPPPKLLVKDGKRVLESKPFVFVNVNLYTLYDVVEYFCEIHKHDTDDGALIRRFEGAIRYLIRKSGFDLDSLMFAIDAARNDLRDRDQPPLNNPLRLEEYKAIGREYREVNAHHANEWHRTAK